MLVAQAGGSGSILSAMILPLSLLAVMYFLVIRPQQKQVSTARDFRASLKSGDKIITAGGLFATIAEFDGDVAVLQLAPAIKVRCRRDQIVEKQPEAFASDSSSDGSDSKSSKKGS
jgi:preprotein translocase subunit YajC